MRRNKWMMVLLGVFLAANMMGCAKKVGTQPGVLPGAAPGAEGVGPGVGMGANDARWRELGLNSEPERREFLQRAQSFENEDIYFDFDSYVLTDPAKKVLDSKVEFLKRYPKVRVTVEGHCDERGTNEYNLALGERRANSAYQYLVNSGISPQRLGTVSYGEERPIAAGHDEAAWAKNRRAHFVLNY